MKKYITATALMLSSLGAAGEDTIRYNTGFYDSIEAGLGLGKLHEEHTSHPWNGDSKNKDALTYAFGLGYQWRFHEKGLFAIEGRFNYHDHSWERTKYQNATLEQKQQKIHFEYSYGADAIIGYIHEPSFVYAKAGLEFTNISHKKVWADRLKAGLSLTEKEKDKVAHTHTGFAFGLGYDYAVSERFSLGGEVKHIIYNSKTYNHPDGDHIAGTYKIRPYVTRMMATLKYKI